jgi:hypothetical protein
MTLEMILSSCISSDLSLHIKVHCVYPMKITKYMVQYLRWETGEISYEPLDLITSNGPVPCAQFAKQHGLLDTEQWKRFRHITSDFLKVNRLINQAKITTYKHEPLWKFGYLVPRTHWQAMDLDKRNGTDLWKEAEGT